ncbi:MAG: hypothetical protein HKN12_07420, partial [Gemmatimonadetes bacterium]|nr:hypothetical protein [Gemmatimonadota bacterium]
MAHDVTDIDAPVEASSATVPVLSPNHCAFADGRLHVVGWASWMATLDYSDPYNPLLVGMAKLLPARLPSVSALAVANGFAYVAETQGPLHVVDISSPAQPLIVATIPETFTYLAIHDDTLLATRSDATLFAYDVSGPASPQLIGSNPFPAGTIRTDGVHIVGDAGPDGLAIARFDFLQTSNAPTYDESGLEIVDIAVSGDALFLGAQLWGLRVADVSVPTQPVEIGHHSFPADHPGTLQDIDVSGTILGAAASWNGFFLIDVSDPAAPRRASRHWPSHPVWGCILSGHHAYLAAGALGLEVLNVSDPALPVSVSLVPEVGDIRALY